MFGLPKKTCLQVCKAEGSKIDIELGSHNPRFIIWDILERIWLMNDWIVSYNWFSF